MGFVRDDCEALALRRRKLADGLDGVGERLDGADDDLLVAGQGLGELAALAAILVGDRRDDARRALEVEDGILQLRVDDVAVGDDEDRVERLLLRRVAQVGQEMRRPRDGVRLARASGVLDEVPASGAVRQHGRLQLPRDVQLVVAREDDPRDLLLGVALGDEVAAEDLEPALARPDLLPEVRGTVPARIDGVALAAAVAQVERQELRGRARKARDHVHLVVADGEVHQRAARKREQGLRRLPLRVRVAVEAVLVDGVGDALGEIGLELRGGHGHAVEEEHQVDAVLVGLGVVHLAHDAEPVRGVAGEDVLVYRERRLELGELDRLPQAEQLDALAQHIEGAALIDLIAHPGEERLGCPRAVVLGQGLQCGGLRVLDPGEDVGGEDGAGAVVAGGVAVGVQPPVGGEVLADLGLEVDLAVEAQGPFTRPPPGWSGDAADLAP